MLGLNKLPVIKEFAKRLASKKLAWSVIGMIATSIGMFGGFPEPPKVFQNLVEDYPILKWTLVFVLIFQGMGGQDIYWSIIGTVATFLIYKGMEYLETGKIEMFTNSKKCKKCGKNKK